MSDTDDDGHTTYKCLEGYKVTMSNGNYQCLRTSTEGRMRAGIATRAYTNLRRQNPDNTTSTSRQHRVDNTKTESARVIETTSLIYKLFQKKR